MEETQTQSPADVAPPPSPDAPTARSFDQMNLDPAVRQALDDMGYTVPMEVQTAVYDRVITGKDLMVQSRTGSGKTAAFGIPLAQMLQPGSPGVQALILAPTRELALQVAQEVGKICAYRNLQVVPVYGGAPMGRQIEALKAGAQIVAGTPGRVLDHLRRGTLKINQVKMFVLDECDEMLSMGFLEDIEKIIAELPPKDQRQNLLFSATLPEDIARIAKRHMVEPENVALSEGYVSVHAIDHHYYMVSGLGRTKDLVRVIQFEQPEAAIIFCNTRDDTAMVAQFLQRAGYDAEAISGDLAQSDRERVMQRMRDKSLRFLVATDIAARGIDISDLPMVINYAFPESPEVYVHRTGRTGRAGKSGTAISLIGPREIGSFYYLKLLYKIRPEEREFPSERELRTRREAERYAKVIEECPEDPGDEWRALARRVIQAGEGERIVAAVLKRLLEGAPTLVRDRVAEAKAQATLDEKQAAEARAHGERRPPADRDRDRSDGERPERIERSERRELRSDRPSRGGDRDRPGRGDRGDRPSRGERLGPGADRAGRGERGERSARPERSDRPERAPRAPRPERPAAAAGERGPLTPAAEPPPGGENREFWEAWVDEKNKGEAGAPAASVSGTPVGVEGSPERADRSERADRPERAEREKKADEPGTVRLYLNIGKREGLRAEEVNRLVAESSPDVAAALGRVTVRDTHSYVSIKEEMADAAIAALKGKRIGERELVAERAKR
jgi:ATP-dependent RNA helicase DeaD